MKNQHSFFNFFKLNKDVFKQLINIEFSLEEIHNFTKHISIKSTVYLTYQYKKHSLLNISP